jgi:hypothetical protein
LFLIIKIMENQPAAIALPFGAEFAIAAVFD